MVYRPQQRVKYRQTARRNSVVAAHAVKLHSPAGKRAAGAESRRSGTVMPPETWHEPTDQPAVDYRIVVDEPGAGYRHVLAPGEIRSRLAMFPAGLLRSLQVVHLSRMTRKKKICPCYGMQWGNAIYLYPIEETRIETFCRPPKPAQVIEARMYGARWVQNERRGWQLVWSDDSIRDYYLNNILIHELGHLLDERNTSYADRERYAEWFAIAHGYRPTRARGKQQSTVRRHG